MRIAFDAYWWIDGPPSGRNVVRAMVDSWASSTPDEVAIVVPRRSLPEAEREIANRYPSVKVCSYSGIHRYHASALATASRIAAGFDWFVTQNFAPIRTRGKVATFVHDAIFVDHPEWFGRRERVYLSGMRPLVRRSDLVWTSSRTEASRIERVWPELNGRVEAIGLAPSASLANDCDPTPRNGRPYILAVGRVNVRKNLGRLIDAYTSTPELSAAADLVIVGPADNDRGVLRGAQANGSVRFTGLVSDSELASLYAGARLFVFPSLDEGFGMPLVEARMFGAPIVASDIPVFRELNVADDYFDPRSVADIARSIRNVILSERAELRSHAEIPTWDEVVRSARDSLVRAENVMKEGAFVDS